MGYKKYKKGIYIGFLILIGVIIFLVVRKQKEDKKEHIVTEQLLETQEEQKETNVIEENQSNNESTNQNKEVIRGTERAIEVKTVSLPSRLREGDLIDVRIRYPNGEEYVVLSKRGCHELSLEEGRMTLFLTEEEILRLSSSIVDCVQMEGTLYTVRYLRQQKQEASISNYMPSIEICNLIKNNSNIIGQATSILEEKMRKHLEERMEGWSESAKEERVDEATEWTPPGNEEGTYYID